MSSRSQSRNSSSDEATPSGTSASGSSEIQVRTSSSAPAHCGISESSRYGAKPAAAPSATHSTCRRRVGSLRLETYVRTESAAAASTPRTASTAVAPSSSSATSTSPTTGGTSPVARPVRSAATANDGMNAAHSHEKRLIRAGKLAKNTTSSGGNARRPKSRIRRRSCQEALLSCGIGTTTAAKSASARARKRPACGVGWPRYTTAATASVNIAANATRR